MSGAAESDRVRGLRHRSAGAPDGHRAATVRRLRGRPGASPGGALEGGQAGAGATGESLTVGEVEMLAMVAMGMTNDQIATRTGASEDSVRWSVRRIRAKLGAVDRASVVDRGWRAGYLGMWRVGVDWSTSNAERLVSDVRDRVR